MEKKNRLITLKTFEEFKAENEQFYPFVLTTLQGILTFLNANGIKRDGGQFNMIDAGNSWKIESNISLTDLQTEDDTLDTEITFHNLLTDETFINVNISAVGEQTVNNPGDYNTEPDKESDTHINIDSITYYKDGADHSIKVTNEISKVMEDIIYTIAK